MRIWIFVAAALAASPAQAKVVSSSANGFEISHGFETGMTPNEIYALFGQPSDWWSPDHTYSGDARRLSMTLHPGGCLCETLPGAGGIHHLRVTYVDPGKRVVLEGALGPLLYEAVAGVMDVQIKPRAAGGSTVTLNYRASGFANGGADRLAPLVDSVLGSQMERLAAVSRKPR